MKFKISATIPIVSFGNIQPEIELEGDNYESLKEEGLQKISEIWNTYAEKPISKKVISSSADMFEEIQTFTGETIRYDKVNHVYTDIAGNPLLSGSAYKKSFDKPFDTALLSGKVGTKYKVDPATVAAMWAGNSKISTTFGSSIHYAMEQWYKYRDSGCAEKEYNLPKHPFLRLVVKSFPLKDENVIPEVFLSSVKHEIVGQADGVLVTGANRCRVLDYKSDAEIEKNLDGHFRQLNFYGTILSLAGWSVEGVEVWNYTDGWKSYPREFEPIDLTQLKK